MFFSIIIIFFFKSNNINEYNNIYNINIYVKISILEFSLSSINLCHFFSISTFFSHSYYFWISFEYFCDMYFFCIFFIFCGEPKNG